MDFRGQQVQDDDVYGGGAPDEDYMDADFDSSNDVSKSREVKNMKKRIQRIGEEASEEAQAAMLSRRPSSPHPFSSTHGHGPKYKYKDPDDGRQRFLLELEFVQCLANPTYIHYLAQNRYFEDEAFIGYLKYLQYWQRPEYAKFIMYPHCLFFLELLQNANFRNAMAHPANKEVAHRQQFYYWKNYRNNRLKHIIPKPLPEPVNAPLVAAPPTTVTAPGAGVPPPAPHQAPSPMQYGVPPGSTFVKTDPKNTGIDRRKRKKDG